MFPIIWYKLQEHIQDVEEKHLFNQNEEDCEAVTFKDCAWSRSWKWTQVREKIDIVHQWTKKYDNDQTIDVVPIRRMGDAFDGATSKTQKWSIQPRH